MCEQVREPKTGYPWSARAIEYRPTISRKSFRGLQNSCVAIALAIITSTQRTSINFKNNWIMQGNFLSGRGVGVQLFW